MTTLLAIAASSACAAPDEDADRNHLFSKDGIVTFTGKKSQGMRSATAKHGSHWARARSTRYCFED